MDQGGFKQRSIARFQCLTRCRECLVWLRPVSRLLAVRKQELGHRFHHVAVIGEEFEIRIVIVEGRIAKLLVVKLGCAGARRFEITLG